MASDKTGTCTQLALIGYRIHGDDGKPLGCALTPDGHHWHYDRAEDITWQRGTPEECQASLSCQLPADCPNGPEPHPFIPPLPDVDLTCNFYRRGLHNLFGTWRDFTGETEFFGGDRDQNLLVRWDWHSWRRHPDPFLRGDDPDELLLFFVLQRKAILCSAGIGVTDDDEPAVREFLRECGKVITAIWEPVALAVSRG